MNKFLKISDVKTGPSKSTSNDQMEIPSKMQVENVQQESACLVQSVVYIKMEPQEDESEFPEMASVSHGMGLSDDINFKNEPIVKIESENLPDEIIEDPLDVDSEIKDEQYFSVDLNGERSIETEPTEGQKNKNLLGTDEDDLHGSRSNQVQCQLLIRNDSNRKDKKCICYECNRTFKKKGDLNKHLRIHTGEKPYSCDVCKKCFTRKDSLDIHMLIHSGEKPHVCDICKKVFNQKSTLNIHKLIHSGEKTFSCDVCGKAFAIKQNLVVHKRIHTDEKPFTCNMCDKAFILKTDLTRHLRTHTGEKPFSCDICKKSFATKPNLNKHKKIHKN